MVKLKCGSGRVLGIKIMRVPEIMAFVAQEDVTTRLPYNVRNWQSHQLQGLQACTSKKEAGRKAQREQGYKGRQETVD